MTMMQRNRRNLRKLFNRQSNRPSHVTARRLRLEHLEHRTLLAADITSGLVGPGSWHNGYLAPDVNEDGEISPLDALLVINDLNSRGARLLSAPLSSGGEGAPDSNVPMYDVNNDDHVSPLDALVVINHLNGEGEALPGTPKEGAFGSIRGIIFNDLSGNGLTADDPRLDGVDVDIFLDGGDGVPDGVDDTFLFQTSSGIPIIPGDTPVPGQYSFDGLEAGTYHVRQQPAGGDLVQLPGENVHTVTITPTQAQGFTGTIDEFNTGPTTTVSAQFFGDSDSSADAAPGALGGERDMFVELTSAFDDIEITASIANGHLEFNSAGFGDGTREISWDGADGDGAVIDPTGLGGIDLTDSGKLEYFFLKMGADLAGTLDIKVFSDADNWSEVTVAIPVTTNAATDTVPVYVPYNTLMQGGTATGPADVTNAGALAIDISGNAGIDGQIDFVGFQGYNAVETADFRNFIPVTLGDQVWDDVNNNGVLDGGETGIDGVLMNLYEDTDGNNVYTPGVDVLVSSTTTATVGPDSGVYQFPATGSGMLPGNYIVQVDAANFLPGGALDGRLSSTGNGVPAPDPDDNVDNDDNGDHAANTADGVVSQAVSLVTGTEPANNGQHNPRVDFGFIADVVDMQIDKVDNIDPIDVGAQLTYTLTVTNNGPFEATNVQVVDTLPPEVSFVSATPSQGTASETTTGVVTANLGDMASGASATIQIVVTVNSAGTGVLTNNATVTNDKPDSDPSNNTTTEQTVVRQVDLAIIKGDNPDPVIAGNTLTYTLVVTNVGQFAATGATVVDTLPPEMTFVSATTTQGTVSETTPGVVTANLGDMPVAGSATITVVGTVASSAVGTIDNTATVSSNEPDVNPSNNTDDEPTTINQLIDLAVTKADDIDPALAGGQLTYTMIVINNGPSDATGVTLVDTLPAEVVFVSATASQGTATETVTGTVTADLGNLAAGAQATVTIVVTINAGFSGTLTNVVNVTGNEPEQNTANNQDVEETQVTDIPPDPSSIAGRVYVDLNDNGLYDGNDYGIEGAEVRLTGTCLCGTIVDRVMMTNPDGTYYFGDLLPGTYQVEEIQPTPFVDGQDTPGTPIAAQVTDDMFAQMVIPRAGGVNAVEFNFGELLPSKREYLGSTP